MTEAEWLACDDPWPMLEYLGGTANVRKMRLFGAACLRRLYDLIPEECWCRAIELIERVADGQQTAWDATVQIYEIDDSGSRTQSSYEFNGRTAIIEAACNVEFTTKLYQDEPEKLCLFQPYCCAGRAASNVVSAIHWLQLEQLSWYQSIFRYQRVKFANRIELSEETRQAVLLRDIVGNPFRAVAFDPRWLTSTAVSLADGIYAERAFDRLPILADSLEDTGCDNADMLAHCRGDGPHVRGCWVVDLVLGKA